jgi:hypothetical protein
MFPRIFSVALLLVSFASAAWATVLTAEEHSPQLSRPSSSSEKPDQHSGESAGNLPGNDVWPSLRIMDKEDGLITDLGTGLVWTKSDNAPGPWECKPSTLKNWWGAWKYVKCLNDANYLGHRDWRLPDVTEIESLLSLNAEYQHPWPEQDSLTRIRGHYYWTLVKLALVEYNGDWMLYNLTHNPYTYNLNYYYYVWPVCSKASAKPKTAD